MSKKDTSKDHSLSPAEKMRVRLNASGDLLKKVLDEMKDPKQFLDPRRVRDLWGKGRDGMRSLTAKMLSENAELIADMESDLHEAVFEDGTEFMSPDYKKLGVFVFPDNAVIQYHLPRAFWSQEQISSDTIEFDEHVIAMQPMTTFKYVSNDGGYLHNVPQEGYMDGNGNSSEFSERSPEDQIQHGGFFISIEPPRIQLLDYPSLSRLKEKPLQKNEVLIEANWYMDSENQSKVYKRLNLLPRRSYNCVGTLLFPGNREQLFFISSTWKSLLPALERTGMDPDEISSPPDPSVQEVATLCNLLLKKKNAIGWKVCGVEFHGGGLLTEKPIEKPSERDFLSISV